MTQEELESFCKEIVFQLLEEGFNEQGN